MADKTLDDLSITTTLDSANKILIRQGTVDFSTTLNILKEYMLEDSAYDYIIQTQNEFNAIIERVAVNQYKIKDGIKSVLLRNLSGGYQMTGGSSPLSGGDSWGYIQTNECVNLVFESGTYIDVQSSPSYIEVNTNDCFLCSVWIKGITGAAASIQRSFLNNALRVFYLNCKTTERNSNVVCNYFEGSADNDQRHTSKYVGCHVEGIVNSNEFRCFYKVENATVCVAKNNTTVNLIAYGFYECKSISSCKVHTLGSTGTHAIAFNFGNKITNCLAYELTSLNGVCHGYKNQDELSGCYAKFFDAEVDARGFDNCYDLSGCYVEGIDCRAGDSIGFENCDQITGSSVWQIRSLGAIAGQDAFGFHNCKNISGIKVRDVQQTSNGYAAGIDTCYNISAFEIWDIDGTNGNAYGINTCERIGCGEIYDIDSISGSAYGMYNCKYITDCKTSTCGTTGIDTCESVIGCQATNNITNGFNACISMQGNRSTGNGTNYTATCYADWAGTVAVADTAAGAWNG